MPEEVMNMRVLSNALQKLYTVIIVGVEIKPRKNPLFFVLFRGY